jgi:hypothetical protein
MRSTRLLLLGAGTVLALAGCGTTSKSGHVGDTLSAGGVQVTLERIDERPPVPSDDVSGLSTPAPGDRLLGARVKVCSKVGPAIGSYDFSMSLADGGQGQVKFPAQNYPDGFDVVRIGCARGWVVFEYPRPTRATEIHFKFDDTGNNAGNVGGSRSETHERFSWKL